MSRLSFKISKEAGIDLDSIWLYSFHKWSKKQADRYLDQILDEIEFIAENFYSGKSIDHKRKNYRAHKIGSHYIYYRRSGDESFEVIRILHQRMDTESHLK